MIRSTVNSSEVLTIVLALVAYFGFTLPYIELPGLQYDEVLFVNAALGNLDGSFVRTQITLLGLNVPLMVYPYIGAVKSFFYAPIFHLFGVTPFTIRVPMIILGSVTLVLIYVFTKLVFGRDVACFSLVLCAVEPSLLYHMRLDWGPVALGMFFKMGSLVFLSLWYRRRKSLYAILGSILMGLGVYDKAIFSWFVLALVLASILIKKEIIKNIRMTTIFLSSLAFVVSSSPFLVYAVTNQNYLYPSVNFVSAAGFQSKINTFLATMEGTVAYQVFNAESPPALYLPVLDMVLLRGTLTPLILAICVCLSTIAVFGCKPLSFGRSKKLLFIIIIFTGMLLQIIILEKASGPHHFVTLLPFPQIIISYFMAWFPRNHAADQIVTKLIRRWFTCKRRRFILSTSLLTLLLASAIRVDYLYLDSFERVGGRGVWSDAIYDLANFCLERPDKRFILMEWGFNTQLLALGSGKVRKIEFMWAHENSPTQDDWQRMYEFVRNPSNMFVFHAPRYLLDVGAYKLLSQVVASAGMELRIVQTFFQRDGLPVIVIYEPTPRNAVLPWAKSVMFREAEDYDSKSGGGLDLKQYASQGMALGMFWGNHISDYAEYHFCVNTSVVNGLLSIRYASPTKEPNRYYVFLDGKMANIAEFPGTGGWGELRVDWNEVVVDLGHIPAGRHILRISPTCANEAANIDFLYIYYAS